MGSTESKKPQAKSVADKAKTARQRGTNSACTEKGVGQTIQYEKATGLITLQTEHTTYQMWVDEHGVLEHLYYGPRMSGDLRYCICRADHGFSGNPNDVGNDRTYSLDVLPQEFPCSGTGDFRATAFAVQNEQDAFGCDLRFVRCEILPGKYSLEGLPAVYADETPAQTLHITLADPAAGVAVVLQYGVLPQLDVITRAVRVENTGTTPFTLRRIFSASLDFLSGHYELIHFVGRHAMERQPERVAVSRAEMHLGSRRGTSSHQENPFVMLAEPQTTEEVGLCYGMGLLYSGGFSCVALADQFDQTRWMMGLQEEQFCWRLSPGGQFQAPEAVMTCSESGFSLLSRRMHRLVKEHICRGPWRDKRRPVLINNWEATYFNFTGSQLCAIAKEAAALGVEMMVLDDGWFGKRDDDNSGLGDWTANEQKLGGPLSQISHTVHGYGMKFGLWVEPEMVNEDSNLYRTHPDWVLALPHRPPVRSRGQLVLDFSRPDVVGAVLEQFALVLEQAKVDYVKMDMNRSICEAYSAAQGAGGAAQGAVLYRYVLGVYEFLNQLHMRFPQLLIEGCSGGGGRFDLGMLAYTPQIWCSDNTDAVGRTAIQYGTSFGYPPCTMGSHVAAVPNHQTGRVTPLATRAVVAMSGSFGYELDLALLTAEEKQQVRQQIAEYQQDWPLVRFGEYHRLSGLDAPLAAWEFAAPDGSKALLRAVNLHAEANAGQQYLFLRGLNAEAQYRLEETGACHSGGALMRGGLPFPREVKEYEAWEIHLTRL